jgi:hypothetical protein
LKDEKALKYEVITMLGKEQIWKEIVCMHLVTDEY